MQTFLPYADFERSARVLDRQRLGKQRVETWQLIRANDGLTKGWVNHPAARMWRGYTTALAYYGIAVCEEWIRRGYKDTMLDRFQQIVELENGRYENPSWLGRTDIHVSHQSNLVRKLPGHYREFFPHVPDDLEYIWPE